MYIFPCMSARPRQPRVWATTITSYLNKTYNVSQVCTCSLYITWYHYNIIVLECCVATHMHTREELHVANLEATIYTP